MTQDVISPKTDSPVKKSAGKAKSKASRPVHFHAGIWAYSKVQLLADHKVQVELDGQNQILPIVPAQVEKVLQQPLKPDQVYGVALWFRTVDEQVTNLQLAGLFAVKPKKDGNSTRPTFDIAGRLEAVDKEEGLIKLKIETNPNGKLQETFVVDIWVPLELMEKLPKVGKTVVALGEYRVGSGRLVAKTVFPKKFGEKSKTK